MNMKQQSSSPLRMLLLPRRSAAPLAKRYPQVCPDL